MGCKKCGAPSSELVTDNAFGTVTCRKCGEVNENNVLSAEPVFAGGGGGGAGKWNPAAARGWGQQRTAVQRSYAESALERARSKLGDLGLMMNIPTNIVEDAIRIFSLCLNDSRIQTHRTTLMSAACLYMACRIAGANLLLMDFAEASQESPYVIGRVYEDISKNLKIKVPTFDPTLSIPKYVAALHIRSQQAQVSMTASVIVSRMNRDWISAGRRPTGVVAAAIYLACRLHGFTDIRLEHIVTVLPIGQQTVLNRLQEINRANTMTRVKTGGEVDVNAPTAALPASFLQQKRMEQLLSDYLRKQKKKFRRQEEVEQLRNASFVPSRTIKQMRHTQRVAQKRKAARLKEERKKQRKKKRKGKKHAVVDEDESSSGESSFRDEDFESSQDTDPNSSTEEEMEMPLISVLRKLDKTKAADGTGTGQVADDDVDFLKSLATTDTTKPEVKEEKVAKSDGDLDPAADLPLDGVGLGGEMDDIDGLSLRELEEQAAGDWSESLDPSTVPPIDQGGELMQMILNDPTVKALEDPGDGLIADMTIEQELEDLGINLDGDDPETQAVDDQHLAPEKGETGLDKAGYAADYGGDSEEEREVQTFAEIEVDDVSSDGFSDWIVDDDDEIKKRSDMWLEMHGAWLRAEEDRQEEKKKEKIRAKRQANRQKAHGERMLRGDRKEWDTLEDAVEHGLSMRASSNINYDNLGPLFGKLQGVVDRNKKHHKSTATVLGQLDADLDFDGIDLSEPGFTDLSSGVF